MRSAIKQVLAGSILVLTGLGSANADINRSLNSVCVDAKVQQPDVNQKLQQVEASYRSKLANFYQGVSCQGKALVDTSARTDDPAEHQWAKQADE